MEPKPKVKCEICGNEYGNIAAHMKAHANAEPAKEDPAKLPEALVNRKPETVAKNTKPVILRNIAGKDMNKEDYFFGGIVPTGFNDFCGLPVDREDLIEVFTRIFKPEHNILFYKARDKEVYLVIVPLKLSSSVGVDNDSYNGDFQKHTITFINEGSVNLDTLKLKLKRIVPFVKYSDR